LVSGIIDGVGGVMGFVPLIMFMFLAIAVMEDSGYMARVAYMLDRVLRWFGLHGNSVVPLIVSGGISGGCAVPGVMATRTLRDPKERIATLLVVPFMNCGAKLPVYAMLIGAFFTRDRARMMFILTLLSWGFALFAAKIIRATVLRGPKTPFVMELPPYRMPTMKGLLIHTWERTWQYIKKAGTIILGFSVILWAMMTFPGLSPEDREVFEDRRLSIKKAFLNKSGEDQLVTSEEDLARLEQAYVNLANNEGEPLSESTAKGSGKPFTDIARVAYAMAQGASGGGEWDPSVEESASRFITLRSSIRESFVAEQQADLQKTLAGWLGKSLEPVTRPLGFDYRVNIALAGGFAAKEVVLSTLGTAYSLGELEEEERGSLSEKLKKDPAWSPLLGFTLIVFTMIYVPCFVTVISIRKESSWKWAGFSIVFNLLMAYVVGLAIYQIGKTLGIGI
jgi:ferrous iron transport protein B